MSIVRLYKMFDRDRVVASVIDSIVSQSVYRILQCSCNREVAEERIVIVPTQESSKVLYGSKCSLL